MQDYINIYLTLSKRIHGRFIDMALSTHYWCHWKCISLHLHHLWKCNLFIGDGKTYYSTLLYYKSLYVLYSSIDVYMIVNYSLCHYLHKLSGCFQIFGKYRSVVLPLIRHWVIKGILKTSCYHVYCCPVFTPDWKIGALCCVQCAD